MKGCPLYNGENLNFTGNQNPYGLIQNAGKSSKKIYRNRLKKSHCRGKTYRTCRVRNGCKRTRRGIRRSYCRRRSNRSA